jgi:ATP-binding cassette subfamily B protein
MSNLVVEQVIGHRTRMAQQCASELHAREDALLDSYLRTSESFSSVQSVLAGFPSRAWLATATLLVIPAILQTRSDHASILISIGGLLQAQMAIASLLSSVASLLALSGSWRSVAPLFEAAEQRDARGVPDVALAREGSPPDIVLEAHDVSFQYGEESRPVLHSLDLVIRRGDRLLIEGPSGGGKSTLAGILCGRHVPQAGLVLVGGLDRNTLGDQGWRRRVATAPQFHENHILTGTLAFNLLMGRAWPPEPEDLQEAETVCRELGLDRLIDKMPLGLSQVVGETGWQLSHGERSRVFLARGLLQRADLLVLDESFGALDPVLMRKCLDCVLARAETLVAVAHP